MMSKWILRGALGLGLFASYDCRRRHNDDDPNSNGSTVTAPTVAPVAPGTGMQPVPGRPGLVPNTQQPTMPPTVAPGMPTVPSVAPGAGDFITSQMALRQSQFALGMNPVMPLARGTLATGAPQNYAVQMQPGHCYKIIGVGAPTVVDLDLRLFEPAGPKIDEDVDTNSFPVLGQVRPLCPTSAGTYRLEVIMYSGQGEFGVQVFGN